VRFMDRVTTCTGAPVRQVWGDGDLPAFVHAHANDALLDAHDQTAFPDQAHLGYSLLMAVCVCEVTGRKSI